MHVKLFSTQETSTHPIADNSKYFNSFTHTENKPEVDPEKNVKDGNKKSHSLFLQL